MFNGQATGLGLADFMLGRVTQLPAGFAHRLDSRADVLGVYAQDTWRVSPRLTLNLGVRWEPFFPLHLTNGAVYGFDVERFRQGVKSTDVPNAPAGLYYLGDAGFPGGAAVNKQWRQFGPRVGFAWDLSGDGRMSVRGYYGMAYDFGVAQNLGNGASAPPHAFRVQLTSPAGGLDNPWLGIAGGNPFPYVSSPSSAVFDRFGNFLPVSEYDMRAAAGALVEPQRAASVRNRSDGLGHLHGQPGDTPVGAAAAQPGRVHPGRTVHDCGRRPTTRARRRRTRTSAASCTCRTRGRAVLRHHRRARGRRHVELPRPAAVGAAPRGARPDARQQLHVVALHRATTRASATTRTSAIPTSIRTTASSTAATASRTGATT